MYVLKNENGINLEEYDEYKNLLEQKEKTEKIISDKDLFDSIYSNKVNIWVNIIYLNDYCRFNGYL